MGFCYSNDERKLQTVVTLLQFATTLTCENEDYILLHNYIMKLAKTVHKLSHPAIGKIK